MIPAFLRNLLLFLAPMALLHAEVRQWKSADGGRSVRGEFVKREASGITIRRSSDRKQVTIPFDKLHPDDLAWVNAKYPPPEVAPPPTGVFDQLKFGDTRDEVLAKLKASKFVELTVAETFLGRTGLNGVFRTRGRIGGMEAMLDFDWDGDGGLKEITLHTGALPATALKDRLIPCWNEFVSLLTTLHGKPINENKQLDLTQIPEGGMAATHLWKLAPRGTALLGAARQEGGYQIAVRFTTDEIQPVVIPEAKPLPKQQGIP